MLAWLMATPADRRLLGGGRLRGPTPWVIAIMSFSIVIIAATGLALASAAGMLTSAIEARYSVEIPTAGGEVGRIVETLRKSPGVTNVDAVPESEMRRTLKRWLGPAADSADLPVPALVNFDLRPGANVVEIEQGLRAIAPAARVTPHEQSVGPLLRTLRVLQWIAFGLVLLLSAAAAAAVVLAARGALDTHRFTIDVMHGIGATDVQVTHLFQRKIAIDAFVGSVAGAAAAALVLLLLTAGSSFVDELTAGVALSSLDLIVLGCIPLLLTALATLVARAAVLSALRQEL